MEKYVIPARNYFEGLATTGVINWNKDIKIEENREKILIIFLFFLTKVTYTVYLYIPHRKHGRCR